MTEPGTHVIGTAGRLRPNAGSHVPLAHAIGREIIRAGLVDRRFIERATSGFEEYEKLVEPWTVSLAAKVTGVPAVAIRELAHAYALGESSHACEVGEECGDGRRALFDLSLLTGRDHADGERRTSFHLVEHAPPVGLTDERYPVRLTEGRRLGCSDTRLWSSGSASPLRRAECVELSAEDAERYGVRVGEEVWVVTRRGATTAPVWVDAALRPDLAFMTVREPERTDTNRPAAGTGCPVDGATEFGTVAIRIEKRQSHRPRTSEREPPPLPSARPPRPA